MQKGMNSMNRRPLMMSAGSGKRKVDFKTVRRLLSYMKEYKLKVAFVLICIILSTGTEVASALFLQVLMDSYVMPLLLEAIPDFAGLFRIILLMCGIYAVGVVTTLFYNRTMCVITQGILKNVRDEMFSHMQTMEIEYFDTHSHGDVMSHYTNDTDTLRQMLSMSVPQAFSSIVTIISVFCAMLTLSLWMTIFAAVFLWLALKLVRIVAGGSGKYFRKQQQSLADVNGYIEEMVNGQKVVKVFCHEQAVQETFDKKNEELFYNASNASSYANVMGPIMNNMGHMLYVSVAIVGGILAFMQVPNLSFKGINIVTLGMIASFLQLSRKFLMPISHISQQLNAVISALAGAERIFKMIDADSEKDEGYVSLVNAKYDENNNITETNEHSGMWAWKHLHTDGSLTYTPVKGEIVFENVNFGYTKDKKVLKDISLYARPGQKVAFVGATGAGKTTITNLINRFYDITDGKIRYDGINIKKIKKSDLRKSLGVVLQEVNLFTGTVMENLRFSNPAATDEECIEAAKRVNAHGFIEMLPQKYDTVISGDGGNLSQGQRQLLSIARAAVADPPVMILDEATSSIDTRTEEIVQKGMDALMKGRTVFIIAHRLSTVKNSDVIMVLDHGEIIECGTHEQLIESGGTYSKLYTGAFELN